MCVLAGMQAKPYRRVDYSHSSVQLMKISHDNQLLVNHLTTISKAVRHPFVLTCRVGAGAQRPIVCMQQLQKEGGGKGGHCGLAISEV
jgi:hypothetical protein